MNEQTTRRNYLRGATALGVAGIGSLSGCVGQLGGTDGSIPFGAILPVSVSGEIGTVGTHHAAAVEQAVKDVNRAGGIDGREIAVDVRDSAASSEQALTAYQELVDAGTLGFVGAVLSSASVQLAERVADDRIVQMSPASTSPQLSEAGRAGELKFFGRTVSSDILQAYVMAKILNSTQYIGADTTAILHTDDAFGSGLAEEIESAFDGTVTASVGFDPNGDQYTDVISEAVADEPDGVALVSLPGSATQSILSQRQEADHDAQWVLSAGLIPAQPPGPFNGVYGGSLASTQTTGAAKLGLKLSQFDTLASFTEQAYDALFVQALALERAEKRSSAAIARNLRAVSGGDGHTVTVGEFERAKKLLANGREVNYRGASGNLDLLATLEPVSEYLVQHVTDGSMTNVELLKRSYFTEVLE
ncbi:ABC transporter substrate-binding protein [Halorhabdus salina]|uniref:ABC transporter substrate-binding protein n=1 Tax=Halorhabdus salina TaxID=2750670 RepID=UPI0015EECDE7|nr:ABC transporter substrate-binding protein [Halorhabdus salina]